MKKIKQFIKDNKEIVIGSILGTGLAVGGKAIYDIGVKHGTIKCNTIWLAMLNADLDETCILRDHCLSNLDEHGDEMKEFVKFGHEMLGIAKKEVGL